MSFEVNCRNIICIVYVVTSIRNIIQLNGVGMALQKQGRNVYVFAMLNGFIPYDTIYQGECGQIEVCFICP